jgi:hypothetical protein
MLFSIFIGLAAVLYFSARAFIIKIKSIFSQGKSGISGKNQIGGNNVFVVYNEGNQYWNVFKPVLDVFEKRGIAAAYLTSAEDDPFFNEKYTHITGEYIGSGNKAFMRLNLLEADICLMTTPGLEVYQLKRSKGVKHYSHILHDTGDATCYRLFGIDWFDSLLLTGEYQKEDVRELERIRGTRWKELVVIGSTYLDVFDEKITALPKEENHPVTVLVSPSWGKGSLLQIFGERLLDPLSKTGWRIIVRPHPQSKKSEQAMLSRLEERYKDTPKIEWDYSSENLATLSKSDIMISDFSGIIFDYIFLFDKPVIYTNAFFDIEMYDASDLNHTPWRFDVVKIFGKELKEADIGDIQKLIETALKDEQAALARKTAKETAWQYIGNSGERAVDFLANKQKTLTQTGDIL